MIKNYIMKFHLKNYKNKGEKNEKVLQMQKAFLFK